MFYILYDKKKFLNWANRSFLLISSLLVSYVSDSHTFAHFLWAMWANRSGCSPKMIRSHRSEEMSDRERIAQVAHQKWANEWIANFFERIAHLLIFGQKTSNSLGKQMSEVPAVVDDIYCIYTYYIFLLGWKQNSGKIFCSWLSFSRW